MTTYDRKLRNQRWAVVLVVISIIGCNFLISGLGWPTYAAIALPPIVVYLLWWIGRWLYLKWKTAENSARHEADSLDEFVFLLNRYCEQEDARKLQHPWLVASLYSYIFGFSLLVYTLATGDAAWWAVILATAVAIACMIRVGYFAEDNPPSVGMEDVLVALKHYRARRQPDYQALIRKISREDWIMEDLVAFAALEERERARSKTRRLQNNILLD